MYKEPATVEKHSRKPKERIMYAAIDIMREEGEPDKVTIRKIAGKAHVGIGLINYHFRTKENLIRESVRMFLGREITARWEEHLLFRKKNPGVMIKEMLKTAADFMAEYPKISRISVLYDLINPSDKDNTAQTVRNLVPLVQETVKRGSGRNEAELIANNMIAAIQSLFLRTGLEYHTGIDFFDKEKRDVFIEIMVDQFLKR